ncbi:LPS-assembly lipoprotein LptE [hydrothermal vent metagenome]|uniref:LPS-assembly lipoprotein LptE n=1 Tax=hydrothermal vent metagenome TaxID=652676 RepID=A0A3B0YK91_9ZZZZ
MHQGSFKSIFVMGLALLLLSACGFKLRGNVELPPILQDTYIESKNPFTGMARSLRSELKMAGANVLENKEAATAILVIHQESSENRVLSVGSTGKATEYALHDEINFSLQDAAGKTLLAPQTLRQARDLVFDQNQLLGKLSEAEGIHRQVRASLARQVIMRIAASVGKQP